MEAILAVVDFVLHIDIHLAQLITQYGVITYAIIFTIVFIETGLVLTPFLPGDSLLFAAGALAALGSIDLWFIVPLLMAAAILGDTANYWIGHFLGERMIASPKIPIKKEHIEKTNEFYAKYGGKTIVLARFVPIVRTFAPFVAGVGKMHYGQFLRFNLIGGVAWVALFSLVGYFFGNIPFIKHNFSLVVMAIIGISVVPMFWEYLRHKLSKKNK